MFSQQILAEQDADFQNLPGNFSETPRSHVINDVMEVVKMTYFCLSFTQSPLPGSNV